MRNLCVACFAVCILGSRIGQSDIRRPPTIKKNPRQTYIYQSEDAVTLECKAEGIPAVSYHWEKNGSELNQNRENIHKGEDGTITIRPATSMDEGFYQCFARNQYGIALSIKAHIQRALLDSSSGTPTVLQKTVQEGMPFHIQADPRKSFPKPTYGWETAVGTMDKSPTPLRPSKRIQIAENGDLYFAYALPEDAFGGRIYKCTTYNHYLDVKAGGSYTQLMLEPSPGNISQFPPTLGFASEIQTVALIGGNVTLRCFFSGFPEPTISWSGPRNRLPIGRYSLNPFNSELTINYIASADEGDYVCTASNAKGRNTHTLEIRVEAVPRFADIKDGPYNMNVTEGESVTFNCNSDAKPEAKIVWLQNGKELNPSNPPKRFVFSNDMKSLTIRDVCRDCPDRERPSDLSVIQCNASNYHGYAFASGYLNVLSKTEVSIHNNTEVTVNTNEGGEVQFECRATSDPSTPPTFQWLKVANEKLYNEPPYLTVEESRLIIKVPANASRKWEKYLGQYMCVVTAGHSKVNQTANITVAVIPVPVLKGKTEVSIHDNTEVTVNTNEGGEVRFECRATSDPSTPPTFQWFKVANEGRERLDNEPPYVTVEERLLLIQVPANATRKWEKYLGQYMCVVTTGHGQVSQTANITAAVNPVPAATEDSWIWIIVGVVGFLVVLIVIFCIVCKKMRNRRTKHCNIANQVQREAITSDIQSSYPLYETIPDHVFTDLGSAQNTLPPFPLDDGLTTAPTEECRRGSQNPTAQSPSLGSGIGCHQSQRTETAACQVNEPHFFNGVTCSTTVDSATQTDNPEMECHCALSRISENKDQLRSEYMVLAQRDDLPSSMYAELQSV